VEGRVRLDNEYIENWSLWLDMKIMVLTVVRAFNDENAF
jgi:putative colanic acid biosynthesis UDP-glucose lipid carrier transferase